LLFSETKGIISSLWTLSVKDRKATLFGEVKSSALPTNAMFSPDGRWVVYQTGQPGATEGTLYAEPFPPTGEKHLISQQGGRPLWSRDGKELFFVPGPGGFQVVAVKTTPVFTVTIPVDVPRGFVTASPTEPRTFDIMPDGRFVVVNEGQSQSKPSSPIQAQQIYVVLNWFEELKAKVPAK
jgi:hypothetical protein